MTLPTTRRSVTRTLALVGKVLFLAAVVTYVAYSIDVQDVWLRLRQASVGWVLVACGLLHASQVVSALRLRRLIYYRSEVPLRVGQAVRLYYAGMFYNALLPGGVGGDAYKIWRLYRDCALPPKRGLGMMLLDRGNGLWALILLAAALFCDSSFVLLVGGMQQACTLALMLAVLASAAYLPLTWWVFRAGVGLNVRILPYSLAVQGLVALCGLALVQALELPHALDLLALFLVANVVAILPLSIGGLGLREVTFVWGLSLLERAPAPGVAFALLFAGVYLATAAVGALALFRDRLETVPAETPPPAVPEGVPPPRS